MDDCGQEGQCRALTHSAFDHGTDQGQGSFCIEVERQPKRRGKRNTICVTSTKQTGDPGRGNQAIEEISNECKPEEERNQTFADVVYLLDK